jgi:diguanylate cyclase
LLFGVLRLSAARLMALALIALLAHGTVLHLSYLRDPAMNVKAALTEFAVLMIVLPWFAAMGGYVYRLRVRLSDSHKELSKAFDRLGELAIRDDLTGAYNRRFLMETLARERARADRLNEPFSVCLLDIDHFKSINDTLGHAAGDAVLKHFTALAAGERVRAATEGVAFPGLPAGRRVTVTIGVATHAKGEDVTALLARADEALYPGKRAGRNRVLALGA